MSETEDQWFDREVDGAARKRRDSSRHKQALVLSVLLVATLATGAALGAFDGGPAEPAKIAAAEPALTPAQSQALSVARAADANTLLTEPPLIAALEALTEEKTLAPSPTPAPDPTPEAVPLGSEPMVIAPPRPAAPKRTATSPRTKPPTTVPTPKPTPPATAAVTSPPTPPEPATPKPVLPEPAPPEPTPPATATAKPSPTAATGAALETKLAAAKTALRARDWRQAESLYGEAVALSPRNANALAGRGQARFELKQTAAAMSDFEAALAVSPTHPRALMLLGSIAQNRGDKRGACTYYMRFLSRKKGGRSADEVRRIVESKLDGCGS